MAERRAGDRQAEPASTPAATEAATESGLYDSVTGFASRELFQDRGAQALNRSKRLHTRVAMFILELELDPMITESQIRQVARQLMPVVRPHDTVSWLDADHVGVLAEDVRGLADATEMRLRLERSVRACSGSSVAISDSKGRMGYWLG
jgi:GGDEF domain-containing protein